MLRCPFCEADLSETGSFRLRGGRCPQCGSILNWAQDSAEESSQQPAAPEGSAPAAPPVDEDAMSMRDIIRTLVSRGGGDEDEDSPPPSLLSPAPGAAPPSRPRLPTPAAAKTVNTGPPAGGEGSSPEQVDRIWSKSITSVATKPSMTIKASSTEPEGAISDLYIRPFRIALPGEITQATNEFELQEVIGEGGVGVVYAARQASIDRTVAIKMLRHEFAHKRDHRNKFLTEAMVTGELDHPNIVPIYDLGTSELGSLFYAMKRVRGTPWSDVVRQQSLAENLRILMSVADAIAFAHSRGVVHRDLKPENVMLGDFGEVLVMDWGIALSTATFIRSNKIGQSTSMGGTPAYMAPEMATGPLTAIGQHSDVYLLGALLFEIVTGRTPHTGKDVMSCLYAAARNEIQPTDKSGELLDVAYRAMATKPDDRYASVQDFQAAVREYQSHSESVVLSTRADEELKQARQTKDYQDFSRALFAFQEAHALWSGNERAKSGEIEARMAYAERALEKGDFDLGLSLLDERQPVQAGLHGKLAAARHEREARQARIKGLRRLALGLAALVMLTLSVGLYFISGQNRTISEQYKSLESTNKDLTQARGRLDEEIKTVQESEKKLLKSKSDLLATNQDLKVTRVAALNEARTARQEEQNAAAASYRAQIGVAAERIANNSFLDADQLLNDYQGATARWSYFRNWEWGYLKQLCDRQAGQQDVKTRIESLARSADGSRYVAGTATGKVLVWEIDFPQCTFRPKPTLNLGGPVLAVALSASGDQLAAASDADGGIALYQRSADGSYDEASKTVLPDTGGVLSLAFSPSGKLLVSSSRVGTAQVWSLETGKGVPTEGGHTGPIWSAVFTAGGDTVVTGGDDGTVRLWSLTGKKKGIYRGHKGPVYAVAAAPRGNWIASAGRDRDVHVWRADMNLEINFDQIANQLEQERLGKLVPEPRQSFHTPTFPPLTGHTGEVRALSFSADGTWLASGGNDNTVKLWKFAPNLTSIDLVTTFRGHGGWVRGCVLAADPRYAVSSSLDGFVKIWDAQEYEEVRALRGHEDAVLWATFSRSGQRMVTAGRDHKALVWNAGERRPLKVFDEGEELDAAGPAAPAARIKEGHEFLVSSVAFLPDDRHVLTSAGDGTVRMWDRRTGGQVRRLRNTGTLSVLALSAGGEWIVTGSDAAELRQPQSAQLWSANDPQSEPIKLTGHPGEVSAAAFSPDRDLETLRIATGDVLGGVRLWRFDAGSRSWQATPVRGHSTGYPISAVKFTPDGRRLLTASQDRIVLIHDALTGETLPPPLKHQGGVKAIDISADSRRALSLSSPGKGSYRISLWDLETGSEQFHDVNLPYETLTSAVFHPSQTSAILTSANANRNSSGFWQWHLGAREIRPLWPQNQVRGVIWAASFSPDGSRLLAAGGSQARLITAQGQLEKTFSSHGAVTSAEFSPDDKLLATSSLDGDVKLWYADPQHPEFGRVAVKLAHPHSNGSQWSAVNSVAFSPVIADNGYRLVTAGNDGTARLWRYAGGAITPEGDVLRHTDRVHSAQFSPDGNFVLTASKDKFARVWNIAAQPPQEPLHLSHDEAVLFAAFSPDGTRVITGCNDNDAYVWDLNPVRSFKLQGHTAAVTSAAISPNGLRAITGSQDGMAKLWDLESSKEVKEVLSLKRHAAELTSAHFSPDGSRILTSSLDGLALVWPSIAIGPSVKLSSARREIPHLAGLHVIDDEARIFDPDAGDLAGGSLSIWPNSTLTATTLDLAAGGDIEVAGGQNVVLTGPAGRKAVAQIERPAEPAGCLRLRLLPGCEAADAQRLLRALAIRTGGPLAGGVTLRVQIIDAEGRASFIAETVVASAEAPSGERTASR